MNRIFNFNQKLSIRIPILIAIVFLSLISISILKSAGNFESVFFWVYIFKSSKTNFMDYNWYFFIYYDTIYKIKVFS